MNDCRSKFQQNPTLHPGNANVWSGYPLLEPLLLNERKGSGLQLVVEVPGPCAQSPVSTFRAIIIYSSEGSFNLSSVHTGGERQREGQREDDTTCERKSMSVNADE